MGLILTRSPFHISRGSLDAGAFLTVSIGHIEEPSLDISQTYTLNFRSNYYLDISPLVRSVMEREFSYSTTQGRYIPYRDLSNTCYVSTTLSGSKNGVAQSDVVTNYVATEGYLFSEESRSTDIVERLRKNNFYAGSTNVIYKLDDSYNLRIPILNVGKDLLDNPTSDTIVASFIDNKGEVIHTVDLSYWVEDSDWNSIQSLNVFDINPDESFRGRINDDDGVLEMSLCLDKFFRDFKMLDIDKISLKSTLSDNPTIIDVKTVEECKHNPYRITFKNRYGAKEDLWFFKKSVKSISVKSDEFRANQLPNRLFSLGLPRSSQEYNKNGKESITLNSGFVDEALNEAFKQLMLSEEVELYDFKNDTLSAVKIKDSEFKFKTSINDKLINYTIEVEMSNSIIDNII
jgi:hypothetical protein